MPTPKPSPAAVMSDPAAGNGPLPAPLLPPELEARLAAFDSAAPAGGFDAASWFWMLLLGVALPLGLLVLGWRA
jgi:hypothetical protein